MQKSKENQNVEAKNRESNRTIIIVITGENLINRYTTSAFKGDVTREDSQRRFLAQHSCFIANHPV